LRHVPDRRERHEFQAGRRQERPRQRRAPAFLPFKEIFLSSLLLSLPIGAVGCGYTLVGTGASALPPNVKTVWVPTFVNDTTVVGVEQRLTDAVLRELSARGRLKPASDRTQADADLNGKLTSLSVTPVRFDDQGLALERGRLFADFLVLFQLGHSHRLFLGGFARKLLTMRCPLVGRLRVKWQSRSPGEPGNRLGVADRTSSTEDPAGEPP
jgi:hypothetical protein